MNSNYVNLINHPETGEAITPSTSTPGWGSIRLDSDPVLEMSGNIANLRKRTAFVRGEIATLETMIKTYGKKFPGKIIKQTSFEPFYAGQAPVMNPRTSEVVLRNGREYYMKFDYVTDLSIQDQDLTQGQPTIVNPSVTTKVAENI